MQHINSHTTKTNVLRIIKNEIHLSLSRGKTTALVLLDFLVVFDIIDHTTLLRCLKSWYGMCGTASKWFMSYLSHRFQAIKIGSALSEFHKLLFGLPQGSVLGALLFSADTTPLTKVIGTHPDIKHHFYADVTKLFIHTSHKNMQSWLLTN